MNMRQLKAACHIKNQGHSVIRAIREKGMDDFKSVVSEATLLSMASKSCSCEFVLACLFEIEKCGYAITGTLDLAQAFAINTVVSRHQPVLH